MRLPSNSARGALASFLSVLLLGPVMATDHVHADDHEGVQTHLEHPDHTHETASPGQSDRVPTPGMGGVHMVPAAVTAAPTGAALAVRTVESTRESPPARAPPPTLRSRAPPVI